uniref:LysM domain-containing protein n=1 Tax=Chlamydomonas leiostraca TaxID=1034604 RepID=A0A7S0R2S3_9CHLO|mmetsp:Transcript_12402/g.30471  ORF Transcript_12402/g.30471 Transcript_12402/m.30471 type:complete len:627 (+) Transcript_12402:44-1924(+)
MMLQNRVLPGTRGLAIPVCRPKPQRAVSRAVKCKALEVEAQSPLFHVVQEGETLAEIASRYGVDIEELKEANPELFGGRKGASVDVGRATVSEVLAPSPLESMQSTLAANMWAVKGAGAAVAAVAVGKVAVEAMNKPAFKAWVSSTLKSAETEIQKATEKVTMAETVSAKLGKAPAAAAALPAAASSSAAAAKASFIEEPIEDPIPVVTAMPVTVKPVTAAPVSVSATAVKAKPIAGAPAPVPVVEAAPVTVTAAAPVTATATSSASVAASAPTWSSSFTSTFGGSSSSGGAAAGGAGGASASSTGSSVGPTSSAPGPATPAASKREEARVQVEEQPAAAELPAQTHQAAFLRARSPAPLVSKQRAVSDDLRDKSLNSLKSGLLESVYGTARGVAATGEQRALIEEYITALEARNPCPRPTDSLEVLDGTWKLVYTSNTQTLMLLNAIDALPLVDIGDVYQVIDAKTLTAHNKIDVAMPMLMSLTAEAGFEVRTPRAFKVRFTKVGVDTYVQTPQLLAALDIPDSFTVLGTTIDLTPLKRMIVDPVNTGLEAAQALVQRAVTPEFALEVSEAASLWMLTTYLDETVRISRDDSGRVFVMLKDVSLYAREVEQSVGGQLPPMPSNHV